ncbi:hypothetical protein DBB29_24600 [Pandoraea cepalis]|uniref:RiboL-PSP-HEPN domain-containing protein n=1 Tax=Pandoraea cepalis TaxID=2508294 RepID=A0AAW7MGI7_9BURK|nr:hypothetical protein [Pandoraea cepalis]MDN4571842.1 hypothetical protein [Pandoraea cepalis]MDN4581296.1 hypothetical protein [Pandoraea cepalis]
MDDMKHYDAPPEAFLPRKNVVGPRDLDARWLANAPREAQVVALCAWFTDRYCDPAIDTPYNGREGGYLYVHGGPYSPDDELNQQFSDVVPDDVIQEAVDDLGAQHGDDWAPIYHEREEEDWEWDEPDVPDPDVPLTRLKARLQEGTAVMTLTGDPAAQALATQLVYVQTLGALEAFLYETALYWIDQDDERVKNCITLLPTFSQQTISLRKIFTEYEGLQAKVREYLYNLVWHRWKDVSPLYEKGLGVKLPSTKVFQEALQARHDIVHRSGADKEGNPVVIRADDVRQLSAQVEAFCGQVAAQFETDF